jgi:hypothetical protein
MNSYAAANFAAPATIKCCKKEIYILEIRAIQC